MNIDRRSFLAGLATIPFLPGCGDTAETNLPRPANVTELKIVAQSWGTSQVSAKIGEILVREQLGLAASTAIVPENAMWESLAKGDAHACFEVWPLRNAAGTRDYIDTGRVRNAGTTGTGRTAWFVPAYTVTKVPEITTATVASSMGVLVSKAGVTELLVGPGDWITPTPARLQALGVGALKVQQQGSEKALLDQLRQAYDARQNFMVSLWYPHPIHSMYELSAVGLPAAAGCPDVKADPFGCDYPAEPIIKAAWPGLKFANPQLAAFIDAFAPPPDDIVQLLAGSQDAPEVLARNWIKSRTIVWTPWIQAARAAT